MMIIMAITFRENHCFSRNKFPFQEVERVLREHAAAQPDAVAGVCKVRMKFFHVRCDALCEIIWCVTLPQVMWENSREDSQSCGTVMNTVISVMPYVCSGRDAPGSSSLLLPVTLNQQLSVAADKSLWGNNAKCLKVPCVLSQNLTNTGIQLRWYADIANYVPKLVLAKNKVPSWFVTLT